MVGPQPGAHTHTGSRSSLVFFLFLLLLGTRVSYAKSNSRAAIKITIQATVVRGRALGNDDNVCDDGDDDG